MTKKAPINLLQGMAGVYQVAAQLCLRGMNPHFPAVDIGADLVVDGGIRIQVKAAHLREGGPYPDGAYWFKLGKMTIRQRRQTWVSVSFPEICEFAVFWGIEENRFWIVPAEYLEGHQCLVIGPQLSYRNVVVKKIEDLLQAGKTQEEIGKILGVSQMTISRRLRGLFTSPVRTLCQQVRNCEGRWDLIEDHVRLMLQAESCINPKSDLLLETSQKEKQHA